MKLRTTEPRNDLRPAPPSKRRRARRGATTTEYMLIMVLIVLPIGLMLPLFIKMVIVYGTRLTWPITLPFP